MATTIKKCSNYNNDKSYSDNFYLENPLPVIDIYFDCVHI